MQRVVVGSYRAALEIKADNARGLAAPHPLPAAFSAPLLAAGPGGGGMPAPNPAEPDQQLAMPALTPEQFRQSIAASRRRQLLSEDMANPLGFSKLRLAGVTEEEIWDRRFPLEVLWACGFPARFLHSKKVPAARLRTVGYTAFDLYHAGYALPQLKHCGFDSSDLRVAGCSIDQLRAALFSDAEIASAGYSTQVCPHSLS